MKYRFPLADVTIEETDKPIKVSEPVFANGLYEINSDEFSMDAKDAGWFYASGGKKISVFPVAGANRNAIELYLNGSVYGAILYQRGIVPLHASSFTYKGRVVNVCGDAGAGKSSLTALFCLGGAGFLTDDVTPVVMRDGEPFIMALSDRIKLWGDTLKEMNREGQQLQKVFSDTDKYYYPVARAEGDLFRPDLIYILRTGDIGVVRTEEAEGLERFRLLRDEIYRPEYLQGMPGNEAVFFNVLTMLGNRVPVAVVTRPAGMKVTELMKEVAADIERRVKV